MSYVPDSHEWSILITALATGVLILSTHVPLGRQVLRRGIIFIDLAIAQIAALGVMIAAIRGWQDSVVAVQAAAGAAAAIGALFMTWSERHWPQMQEAIIGATFVVAASVSLLLLAGNPQAGEHLQEILAGQILWISWSDLAPALVVYLPVLVLWFALGHRLGKVGFYLLFAAVVTISVQLVGIYLVFASLILPALATRSLLAAYLIGLTGYAAGLYASSALDLPAGPAIVCGLTAVTILAGLVRHEHNRFRPAGQKSRPADAKKSA